MNDCCKKWRGFTYLRLFIDYKDKTCDAKSERIYQKDIIYCLTCGNKLKEVI